MKQPNRNKARLEARRTTAAERSAHYATLTPAQKLEALDVTLGKGVGATRQRARLLKAINVATGPAQGVSKAVAAEVFGVEAIRAETAQKDRRNGRKQAKA